MAAGDRNPVKLMRPDNSKQMSSDSLYNFQKALKKCFQKINTQKGQDNAVQSNIPWLKLKKIDEKHILQLADKYGNPSFHIHAPGSKRRYPCTHTASAVPK